MDSQSPFSTKGLLILWVKLLVMMSLFFQWQCTVSILSYKTWVVFASLLKHEHTKNGLTSQTTSFPCTPGHTPPCCLPLPLWGEPSSWPARGIPHLVTSYGSCVLLCAFPCHFYLPSLGCRLWVSEGAMTQMKRWEHHERQMEWESKALRLCWMVYVKDTNKRDPQGRNANRAIAPISSAWGQVFGVIFLINGWSGKAQTTVCGVGPELVPGVYMKASWANNHVRGVPPQPLLQFLPWLL